MLDDYLKANLASWDEAVGLHVGSELYDVAGFKAGGTSLSAIELGELGPLVGDGHVAAAPAVPLRPRHAELGAPGRHRHRRRLLRRGDQDGARPGRRGRPLRARHLRAERRREPAGQAVRLLRRRLHLLGRPDLAGRPRALGRRDRPLPQARRRPLRRRVPPLRLPARRRRHPGLAAHRLPVLHVRRAPALRRGRRLRRARRQARAHGDLRVAARLRRDHRPAAAPRPAPRLPARAAVHRARPALHVPREGRPAACCG